MTPAYFHECVVNALARYLDVPQGDAKCAVDSAAHMVRRMHVDGRSAAAAARAVASLELNHSVEFEATASPAAPGGPWTAEVDSWLAVVAQPPACRAPLGTPLRVIAVSGPVMVVELANRASDVGWSENTEANRFSLVAGQHEVHPLDAEFMRTAHGIDVEEAA